MYPKHKVILLLISIAVGGICCLLKLHIVAIASDVISVLAISSALYLAAYAGIQASTQLKENLKQIDNKLPHRTQLYVLNVYFKFALVLNIIAIVSMCASSLVADKIAQYDTSTTICLFDYVLKIVNNHYVFHNDVPQTWLIADTVLNFASSSLFAANLVQMSFIGIFVVNRIPFDK